MTAPMQMALPSVGFYFSFPPPISLPYADGGQYSAAAGPCVQLTNLWPSMLQEGSARPVATSLSNQLLDS